MAKQGQNQKIKTRNLALLFVEPAGFAAMFKEGLKFRANTKIVKGLPEDAVIEHIFLDNQRAGIMIIVRSKEFAPVQMGVMPPILHVEIEVS